MAKATIAIWPESPRANFEIRIDASELPEGVIASFEISTPTSSETRAVKTDQWGNAQTILFNPGVGKHKVTVNAEKRKVQRTFEVKE